MSSPISIFWIKSPALLKKIHHCAIFWAFAMLLISSASELIGTVLTVLLIKSSFSMERKVEESARWSSVYTVEHIHYCTVSIAMHNLGLSASQPVPDPCPLIFWGVVVWMEIRQWMRNPKPSL